MSVNSIPNSNPLVSTGSLSRTDTRTQTRTDATRSNQTGRNDGLAGARHNSSTSATTLKPQAPIAGQAAATQGAVPAEAPAGTDPELWSVLTAEERNFFAKSAALGPLTYSRIKAASQQTPPAARGVRLDVRA